MAKRNRDMFEVLPCYPVRNSRAKTTHYMGKLEGGPTEGVENDLLPQDSSVVSSVSSSVEQLGQMDTRNTVSADVIMALGEHSESTLYAEYERRTPEEVEKRVQIDSDMSLEASDFSRIVPPSKVPNISLEHAREDGDEVATSLEMQDDKTISDHSLEGQKVLLNVSDPYSISIIVSIDGRIEDAEENCIEVAVRLDQTLGSLKELLLHEHSFRCADHSLILTNCELKGEEQILGDLGFAEGCTVHAVAAVELSVVTLTGKEYMFSLKATTRISAIRELVHEADADAGGQDDYAFSLDGVHTLLESTTLWDLHIYSGMTFILMVRFLVSLSIQYFGLPSNLNERLGTNIDDEISIDDSLSLDDLRAQILGMVPSAAKWAFQPPKKVYVSHQGTPLSGTRTIREEQLEDGDVVDITLMPLAQRTLKEVEDRGEIESDIYSPVAPHLSHLGAGYQARFEQLGDFADLENAITMLQQALALTPDGYPDKPNLISNLSTHYFDRFERLGDLADLENAITTDQQALTLTPDGHPDKPNLISNLGTHYSARFDQLGDLADLENAITMEQQALTLTPDGHPDKPGCFSNLGTHYSTRFERLGDIADIENAITIQQQALALTPDGHPKKSIRLSNLGTSYSDRFDWLGDLVDLENAIAMEQQALTLTPDGHPDKPGCFSNLGTHYSARFGRSGDLADIENAITMQQQALALTPDGHPDKPGCFSNLGTHYSARFERLGDLADLENAITTEQQALTLTPDSHPDKPTELSNLSTSYSNRFKQLGDLADLENAITTGQQALTLTPDGHPDKPSLISNLSTHYFDRFDQLGDLADLENVITMDQQALTLTPDGHPDKPGCFSNLGTHYSARFGRLGDLADIENAITMQQQALALTPDGHPNKPGCFSNLGTQYSDRFGRLGDLADLENAITTGQQALTLTPDDHPSKPTWLSNLGTSYSDRFERLGDLADLENAITMEQQALTLTPDGHPDKPGYFSNLGTNYSARFVRLGDLADLENAITTGQQAVTLTPDGHPSKPKRMSNLGAHYYDRFGQLGDPADLENAIKTAKLAAQSLGGSPSVLLEASKQWAYLSLLSGDFPSAMQAFRTAIEILPEVAWLGLDIPSRQDLLAKEKPEELGCRAATCAIRLGKLEEAVELVDMARSVFWQQASSVRSGLQDLKAERPELAEELENVSQKLDISSFSGLSTSDDNTQPYERRLAYHRDLVLKRESLIKEIRSLPGFEFFLKPTPFNRLRDAAGAGRVVIINVSKLGTDALIFDRTNPIRHVPLSAVDVTKSFKHSDDIELQQKAADHDTQDQERSLTLPEVLDRIDIDTLKSGRETDLATSDGIVRRQGRADVTDDLESSLARLPRVWEHILKPIFAENGLDIPLQRTKGQVPTNRIFWYLTGPLTVIPIHAAGPVSQLVVSSYVTTLSSLAEAQKRQSKAISGPPMLLAISQPNTPNQSRIPHATDEVDIVLQTVLAAGWPKEKLQHLDRTDATIDQVSTALNTCAWAHFACHAMQDPRDGMESAFALQDGRLKLSVIAAKRIASARFAFLSTCQSASGLEDSPGEAIHLSAGMQFAGFSSVIATMWSIQDKDGPVIAKHTYEYLLRNGLDKVDLTEAAAALNYAVSRLREDPAVKMERWAPFVYYGV